MNREMKPITRRSLFASLAVLPLVPIIGMGTEAKKTVFTGDNIYLSHCTIEGGIEFNGCKKVELTSSNIHGPNGPGILFTERITG